MCCTSILVLRPVGQQHDTGIIILSSSGAELSVVDVVGTGIILVLGPDWLQGEMVRSRRAVAVNHGRSTMPRLSRKDGRVGCHPCAAREPGVPGRWAFLRTPRAQGEVLGWHAVGGGTRPGLSANHITIRVVDTTNTAPTLACLTDHRATGPAHCPLMPLP